MESLLQTVQGLVESYAVVGVGALIFLVLIFLFMGIASFAGEESAVERRLSSSRSSDPESMAGTAENVAHWFARWGKSLPPTDLRKLSQVRQLLIRAGYYNEGAVPIYYGVRVFIAVALPVVFSMVFPLITRQSSLTLVLGIAMVLGAIGLFLPVLFVELKAKSRQQEARMGFPDMLDILVVCVEAGLSLDQSIDRVSREIGRAHPVLGENLRIMTNELRAGRSRTEALRNLSERLGVDEVRSLVTMLIQSEELGTSIADTLRVYIDEMRNDRLLRAEEKAQSLPARLAIPLALCVFPVLLIIILLPVVIRLLSVMGDA